MIKCKKKSNLYGEGESELVVSKFILARTADISWSLLNVGLMYINNRNNGGLFIYVL